MACVAAPQHQHPASRASSLEVSLPVIMDSGDRAAVALVTFPHAPRLGDRFAYSGCTWEITHTRDSLRGFVARPIPQQPCVC